MRTFESLTTMTRGREPPPFGVRRQPARPRPVSGPDHEGEHCETEPYELRQRQPVVRLKFRKDVRLDGLADAQHDLEQ